MLILNLKQSWTKNNWVILYQNTSYNTQFLQVLIIDTQFWCVLYFLFVYKKLMIHKYALCWCHYKHNSQVLSAKYKSDQVTVHSSWTKNFYFFNFVTILLHCLCPTWPSVKENVLCSLSRLYLQKLHRNKSKKYSQLRQTGGLINTNKLS